MILDAAPTGLGSGANGAITGRGQPTTIRNGGAVVRLVEAEYTVGTASITTGALAVNGTSVVTDCPASSEPTG